MAGVHRSNHDMLLLIIEHTEVALALSDEAGEPMLGAKLNDALICAIERRDAAEREGGRNC